MPRALRAFVPGGHYHLTARGNDRRDIVVDDVDRRAFVSLLAEVASRFLLDLHAWCLLSNHYHLVVRSRTGAVSAAMARLNGGYARRYNERHGRTGHVFGERFRTTYLESEEHLNRAREYVHLNPVRAGLVELPEQWLWSSASGAVGRPP